MLNNKGLTGQERKKKSERQASLWELHIQWAPKGLEREREGRERH